MPDCIRVEELELKVLGTKDYTRSISELLREKSSSDYRYRFKSFVDKGAQTYMIVTFISETQCFDVLMKVRKWDALGGMRKTNGKSYPKELRNLKWEIVEEGNTIEINYLGMSHIID